MEPGAEAAGVALPVERAQRAGEERHRGRGRGVERVVDERPGGGLLGALVDGDALAPQRGLRADPPAPPRPGRDRRARLPGRARERGARAERDAAGERILLDPTERRRHPAVFPHSRACTPFAAPRPRGSSPPPPASPLEATESAWSSATLPQTSTTR